MNLYKKKLLRLKQISKKDKLGKLKEDQFPKVNKKFSQLNRYFLKPTLQKIIITMNTNLSLSKLRNSS